MSESLDDIARARGFDHADDDPEAEDEGIRTLRQRAAGAEVAEVAEADAAAAIRERDLLKAGVRAGIDITTKAGAGLLKVYEGDVSDVEALKREAEAWGIPLRGKG